MTEAKNRRSDTVWTSEANTLYPSLKRELKQAGCFDRVPWSTRWGRPSCVLVAAVDDDRTRAVAARLAPRCAEVTTFVAGTPAFDAVFAEPAA